MNAWLLVLVVRMLAVGALGATAALIGTLLFTSTSVHIFAMLIGVTLFLTADVILLPWRIRHHQAQGRLNLAVQELEILSRLAPTRHSRTKARLAQASMLMALGHMERGGALLKALPRDSLPDPLKATWDMNHAYYLLATHKDPVEAFRIADQVPSQTDPTCPPAFPPTRGLALLAMGRTKDAITDLTRSLDARDLGAWQRAEAHYHLAQAWKALGHPAYASDHLIRTCNTCAASPYAERASTEISKERRSSTR